MSQNLNSFVPSSEGVSPGQVPQRLLSNGALMPAIGLGTFGSDHVSAKTVAEAVYDAVHLGYRHIDCASVYGNEAEIGEALQRLFDEGLERRELWVTSKVWNDAHEDVIGSCQRSLKDLRLEYLDLYLVHWPFPNHHARGCDVHARNSQAVPYMHENYMRTWRQMEELVDRGMVRGIGTSNMTVPKLELLLRDARIRPVVNEMELHPHFQQKEFFSWLKGKGIEPIGYSPIGSPARPERDRTPEDTSPSEDPVIRAIASQHGVHPAVICIQWAIQRGHTPIPFSTTRRNYLANLQAAISAPLSEEEMRRIEAADRNCRLIKGQVFLWKEDQSWEDLWDLNGVITPA
jgi:diketogulonate reductase-like aldo/keto reductase